MSDAYEKISNLDFISYKEDTTKKISFDNQIQSADENEKTVIDQFSANNGGYIMILVKDIFKMMELL